MRKINVLGAYGEANFGDDLLMIVFEKFLLSEFPGVNINFEGQKADYASKILKEASYNDTKFEPDLVIYGGGTQFFSFRSTNDHSIIEKVKLVFLEPRILLDRVKRIFKSRLSRSKQIKTSFIGFGLGPFNDDDLAINSAKKNIKEAEFVGVRDSVSYDYCSKWGVDSFLGADVVFSSYFDLSDVESKNSGDIRKIGIIVRDWDFERKGKEYILKIQEFYEKNVEYNLQFIVFSPLKDKKWMKYLKEEDMLVWNPIDCSITGFLNKLNDFDLLISARYHGAIIGLLLKKPVICIEIEPKLEILTQQISELKLWEKPFCTNNLKELINTAGEELVDYTKSVETRRELADNMLKAFKSLKI